MSSLSSWSLSDLFILLLLAILPRIEKRKGRGYHTSAHYFYSEVCEGQVQPTLCTLPPAPWDYTMVDCTRCLSLEQAAKRFSPTVGDSAAVTTHSQALLQVGGKAGSSNTATAIGANTLLALPLVENLSKDVQPRLVHDLWGQERRGDQRGQSTLTFCSHLWSHTLFKLIPA